MFCLYNHLADCFDCGRCKGENEKAPIWDFDTETGQNEFLEDLWQFVFSRNKPSAGKCRVISPVLQRILEQTEQQIIENAKRYIA